MGGGLEWRLGVWSPAEEEEEEEEGGGGGGGDGVGTETLVKCVYRKTGLFNHLTEPGKYTEGHEGMRSSWQGTDESSESSI